MRKYYGICIALGVSFFLIIMTISGIASCSSENRNIKATKAEIKNSVIIRYCTTDDINTCSVVYFRTAEKDNFIINFRPTKEGYSFAGWYDGRNPATATIYAGADGTCIRKVTKDIMLYPVFASLEV